MAYSGGYVAGYVSGLVPPLTSGTNTYHARAAGYGAFIGEHWVRLAPSREAPLRYYTQDSLAPRSDDRSSTDENVLELGHKFSRSDLTGGAGLDFFPRPLFQDRDVTDNIRFWDAMNVDIRRTRVDSEYSLRLHRKLEEWDDLDTVTHIERTSTYLYIADGNLVKWYDSLDNVTVEGSHDFSNPVDDLTTVGDDVYALSNDDVWVKLAGASSFSSFHAPTASETIHKIWGVKNRVIAHRTGTAPVSNSLVDLQDGVTELPFDDFNSGIVVNDVVDGGPAVIAGMSSGDMYSYGINSTSNLLEPLSTTPLPIGEQLISMASNQGALVYMTVDTSSSPGVARLYAGEVLDSRFNNTIGESDLIMEWTTALTDVELLAARDDVWWVMYESDVAGDQYVSIYRFDQVTRGFNRAHAIGVSSDTQPNHLTLFQDRMVFINDGDVWAESSDTYADVGWLISPSINFGLDTSINWVATVVDVVDVISGGLQVELLRSSRDDALFDWQSTSWVAAQKITAPEQAGNEVNLISINTKSQTLQVRLYPHTGGTPGVQNFAIRGLPQHRDLVVEVPINISDIIEVPGRAPKKMLRWGDTIHTRIFGLAGKHLELHVLDPPISMLGIIDQIAEPTEYLTDRGSQGRYCVVRVRGKQITATVAAVGTAGIGIGMIGVFTIGIGQLTQQQFDHHPQSAGFLLETASTDVHTPA